MTVEAFDPYRKWLGIPQSEQPPHHYRLLGIGLFEDDPDVIESAADQRMSHLRTFQASAHSALSQKLLNEVAAAKVCLLSKDQKAAYDGELRRRLDATKPASQAPLPKAKLLPTGVATEPAGLDALAVIVTDDNARLRPAHTKRSGSRRSAPVWWAAGAAIVLLCGLLGYVTMGRAKPAQTAAKPPSDHRQSEPAQPASKPEPKVADEVAKVSPNEPRPAPPSAVANPPSAAPVKPPEAPAAPPDTILASADGNQPASDAGSPPRAAAPFDEKQAREHQQAWAAHLNVPVEQKNSIGMLLILIPPGEFTMGSTAEQIAEATALAERAEDKRDDWTLQRFQAELPAHRVTITRPCLLGATEVTVGQYRRFVDDASYVTESERFGGGSSTSKEETDAQKRSHSWKSPSYPVTDDSAVGQLTWNDAVAFCNWLSEVEHKSPCYRADEKGKLLLSPQGDGYRLPTEAEWEYACRAGTTTQYSFADDLSSFDQYGWSIKTGPVPQPHLVAVKRPNAWGLFDMHGNVEEWCHDWLGLDYYKTTPAADPTGPASGDSRVRRGGAWDMPVLRCRCAFRGAYPPFWRFGDLGFRVMSVSTKVDGGARPLEMAKQDSAATKLKSPDDVKKDDKFTAEEAFTLKDHVGAVTRVAFHPNMPLLASAGKDGRVFLWNLDKKSFVSEFARFKVEVWAIKFSPNGELLTYGSRDWWKSEVSFKTVDGEREVKSLGDFKFGGGAVASIAFSPDGLFFAAGQDDGTVRLWSTTSFQEVAPLSMGSNVLSMAFGPIAVDRKRKRSDYLLAAGCQDGSLKTLAITATKGKDDLRATFEPTDVPFPQLGSVLAVRFSPDGKLLGCTRSGGLIALCDPKTGESVRQMQATGGEANWISFHPQRPWCLTAHKNDRLARVWNTDTGDRLCELRGHTGGVLCAEFSRDGRRIATASEDFSIKLWDLSGPGVPAAAKRLKKGKTAAPVVGD